MGSSVERAMHRGRSPPGPLRIVNWPLRDRVGWSLLTVTVFIAVGTIATVASGSALMGMFSLTTLAVSAWKLWIPVTFDLTSKGVVQSALGRNRRIAWSQIAGYQQHPHGVMLWTDREPTPLVALRGLYICWNDQREELIALLDSSLQQRAASSSSSTQTFVA